MSKPSSPSKYVMFMVPSSSDSAFALIYHVIGSSSAQSSTASVFSVHSCAAALSARSSIAVIFVIPDTDGS